LPGKRGGYIGRSIDGGHWLLLALRLMVKWMGRAWSFIQTRRGGLVRGMRICFVDRGNKAFIRAILVVITIFPFLIIIIIVVVIGRVVIQMEMDGFGFEMSSELVRSGEAFPTDRTFKVLDQRMGPHVFREIGGF
jgi:hypothetical protein